MLIFTRSLRVCLALAPVDLRKSFEGLAALVTHVLHEEARSSQVFVFTNKRHDRVRLLYWDGTGLWVMTKRLEQGTFAWPKGLPQDGPEAAAITEAASAAPAADAAAQADDTARPPDGAPGGRAGPPAKLRLRAEVLEMLLSGIDLKGARLRPWYERP